MRAMIVAGAVAVSVLLSASMGSAALITVNFNFTDPDFSGSFTYDDTTAAPNFTSFTQYDVTAISVVHSTFGSWDLTNHVGSAQVIALVDSSGQFAVMDAPAANSNATAVLSNGTADLNLDPPTRDESTFAFRGVRACSPSCGTTGAPFDTSAYTTSLADGTAPIPEPTSGLLFAAGLLIVGGAARRRA